MLPDGEAHKDMPTLVKIMDAALSKKLDRKSTFVALGGGVIGDMVGFAAAIYQRGVNFIQVPTTLMAMVDSAVGGKTGRREGGREGGRKEGRGGVCMGFVHFACVLSCLKCAFRVQTGLDLPTRDVLLHFQGNLTPSLPLPPFLAVNHALGKNMIGAFYQPQCVIIDTDTLNSLPDRELASGIAEIVKYGLIRYVPPSLPPSFPPSLPPSLHMCILTRIHFILSRTESWLQVSLRL